MSNFGQIVPSPSERRFIAGRVFVSCPWCSRDEGHEVFTALLTADMVATCDSCMKRWRYRS